MRKQKFHCLNCGHDFLEEVLEEGEAAQLRVSTRPVCCPRCKRQDLRKE